MDHQMNDDERAGNGVTMEEEEQEGEGMEEQEHEGMEEPVRDMDNDDDYLPNFGEEEQEDAPAEELPTQNHDYGNHEDDDDDDEDNEEEDNDNEEEHDNDDIRKDDDDDDDDDEEVKPEETETADPNGSKESPEEQNTTVGGTHPKEALCIFDGLVEQNDDDGAPKLISEWERVTLLIKRLPATIGRAHVTSDKNFVSLGAGHHHPSPKNHPPAGGKKPPHHKSVSRQHVRIDYRVPSAAGGCGHVQTKVGYRSEFFYNHTDDPLATSAIRILPPPTNSTAASVDTHNDNDAELLPATGFFTLTCLGKNRVLVNGTRIEANETVWLRSGTAIRIANYLLYFLTPLQQQEGGGAKRTIQIRDDIAPVHNNKQRKLSLGVSTARPALIGSGTGEGIAVDDDDDNVDEKNHSFRGAASRSMQSEIESLSTDKLLLEMKTAQEADVWDRRHQLIGATLSYRAVRDAAHDTEWYEREGGTVSRSAVMEWVASSDKFGAWVEHMLSKLEPKSYQASITKGMIKAGYIRTTSSGRYIKWIVPRTTDHKAQASAVARNDLNESNHSIGQESLPSDE